MNIFKSKKALSLWIFRTKKIWRPKVLKNSSHWKASNFEKALKVQKNESLRPVNHGRFRPLKFSEKFWLQNFSPFLFFWIGKEMLWILRTSEDISQEPSKRKKLRTPEGFWSLKKTSNSKRAFFWKGMLCYFIKFTGFEKVFNNLNLRIQKLQTARKLKDFWNLWTLQTQTSCNSSVAWRGNENQFLEIRFSFFYLLKIL